LESEPKHTTSLKTRLFGFLLEKENPVNIIDESATIKGADIEKVYDNCLEWLEKRNSYLRNESVKILNQSRPEYLEAQHYFLGAEGGIVQRKKIMIYLEESENSVIVRLVLSYRNVEKLIDPSLTASAWSYLFESLWDRLGIKIDENTLRRINPESHLDILRYGLIFVVGVCFTMGIFFFWFGFSDGTFLGVLFGLSLCVFFILTPLDYYWKALRKKKDIYPD